MAYVLDEAEIHILDRSIRTLRLATKTGVANNDALLSTINNLLKVVVVTNVTVNPGAEEVLRVEVS